MDTNGLKVVESKRRSVKNLEGNGNYRYCINGI